MIQMPVPVAPRADGPIATLSGPGRETLRFRGTERPGALAAKVRVRVAHGLPLIASGVAAVLAKSGDFEVSVFSTLGASDVLVADVDTGLRALSDGGPHRRVIVIAQDDGEVAIRNVLEKGARGFLLQNCSVEELTNAVKTVSRGGTAFAPVVTNRIAESFSSEPLTRRELEVLRLMVHGLSDKDMARKLIVSLGTVKSHMKSILTKLGATRRTEAAAIAQRRGIARLDGGMP